MTTRRFAFAGIILMFAIQMAATVRVQAGLILSFSPSSTTVNANGSNLGSVTISVQARANEDTQILKGYDFFIDVATPTGKGIPAGWTVSNFVEVQTTTFPAFSNDPPNADVYVGGAKIAPPFISLTETTSTTLWTFDLNFNADNGAVDGSYSLTYLTSALGFAARDETDALISPITTIPASITLQNIVATPEPSTLLLFSIAGIGWGSHRLFRIRSKRAKSNGPHSS